MKLEDIARAYVACVELGERIQAEAPALTDEINELRADLHALLMSSLRENKISFADRAQAAAFAFQIAKAPAVP
jgi:hypothetical protein